MKCLKFWLVVKSGFVTAQIRKLPAPPVGIIASIASGFETVNARLELILLPLVLDLFLWLGPHLSVKPVLDQSLAALLSLLATPAGVDQATAQSLETLREQMKAAFVAYGERFNFFSRLSTLPLGLPSLIGGRGALLVPGGTPVTWFVDNAPEYVLLFVSFSLLGLFLGAFYFGGIAQQVRDARLNWRLLLQQVWGDWARLTALTTVAFIVLALLSLPVLLVAVLLALIHPLLASFAISTVALWLLIYLGFTLHGIILQRRGLFSAMWDSIRLAHASLPQTLALYTAVIFIYVGLDWVWSLAADDSWLLLVGVLGHAVVATALVAATFVFYKDRYRWWMELRQMTPARVQAGQDEMNRSRKA
jgi:hypothetical protein